MTNVLLDGEWIGTWISHEFLKLTWKARPASPREHRMHGRSGNIGASSSFKRGDRVYYLSRSQTFGTERWYGTVVTGHVSMRLWEGIGRVQNDPEWSPGPKEPHVLVHDDQADQNYWQPVRDLHRVEAR